MNKEKKRLIKIDNEICRINSFVGLTDIYPINVEEEKEKFLANDSYNPQFTYNESYFNFKKIYKDLNSLPIKDSVMDKLFSEKIKEIILFLKMVENLGKRSFTTYSIKLYGKPDLELIKKAKKITEAKKGKTRDQKESITSKNAIKKFERLFKKLDLNWEAREGDIASNAIVIPSKRMFMIKRGKMYSRRGIRRLIAHELYTHIIRAEIGLSQPFKIFSIGLGGYEPTEEGLALYKEKRSGFLDKKSLLGYATRVMAVNQTLSGSFRDVFNLLLKFYKKESAWDLSVRVKRGISDTSKKGGFTKDAIYLKGFLEVDNFITNQHRLDSLHYGKIGIHHTELIHNIENLKSPLGILNDKFKNNLDKISYLF